MISIIRNIRHGPLARFKKFWFRIGSVYKFFLNLIPFNFSVTMNIGPYGPFRLDARFAFSNFSSWGDLDSKNSGFLSCIERCKKAKCAIDVGAHIGLVTLPMNKVMESQGKIFAFEPANYNRNILKRHLKINHIVNVEVFDFLVGKSSSGRVEFYEESKDSPLGTIALRGDRKGFIKTHKKQISLDIFCENKGISPDIIKIDVEGGEIGVLLGSENTIRKYKPIIFLSVHPSELEILGSSVTALAKLIKKLNYISYDSEGRVVHEYKGKEYILKPNHEL